MENKYTEFCLKIPCNLYEYRNIIFQYLYGEFIILQNKNNFRIFFRQNQVICRSKYFKKIFKLNKFKIKIPENIMIRDIHIKFIYSYLLCDGVFYLNYVKNMKYYEFEELIILLKYFDLMKFDIKRILTFYKNMINITYNMSNVAYKNVEIGHLLHYDEFNLFF